MGARFFEDGNHCRGVRRRGSASFATYRGVVAVFPGVLGDCVYMYMYSSNDVKLRRGKWQPAKTFWA